MRFASYAFNGLICYQYFVIRSMIGVDYYILILIMLSYSVSTKLYHFSVCLVYASIDVWTVVAVFCLRLEEGAESGFDVGFVEGAVVAVLWEIGVVIGEEGTGLGGIAGETGMGSVARRRNRRERGLFFGRDGRGRLVGGGEGAFAVPAVAGAVLVPEGVVDGEDGVPVETVVCSWIGGCGWEPFEVGEDVLLGEELLPLCGLAGT